MKRLFPAFLAAFLIAAPVTGWSQTIDQSADQRTAPQTKRAAQGVTKGSFVKSEAAKLRRQQARLQKREAAAQSEGVAAQKAVARRIAKQKSAARKAVN